jgi:uncharacterized protein
LIVRLLSWLVDALVLFLIVRSVLRMLTAQSAARPRPGPPPGPTERQGGTLVRDPQCGTYVPESRAVTLESGGQTLYFCSAACRDAYRART